MSRFAQAEVPTSPVCSIGLGTGFEKDCCDGEGRTSVARRPSARVGGRGRVAGCADGVRLRGRWREIVAVASSANFVRSSSCPVLDEMDGVAAVQQLQASIPSTTLFRCRRESFLVVVLLLLASSLFHVVSAGAVP